MLEPDYTRELRYQPQINRFKGEFGDCISQEYTLPPDYYYRISYKHYEITQDITLNFQQLNAVIELCINLGSTVPIEFNGNQSLLESGSFILRSMHHNLDQIKLNGGNSYKLLTIHFDSQFFECNMYIPHAFKDSLIARQDFVRSYTLADFDEVRQSKLSECVDVIATIITSDEKA